MDLTKMTPSQLETLQTGLNRIVAENREKIQRLDKAISQIGELRAEAEQLSASLDKVNGGSPAWKGENERRHANMNEEIKGEYTTYLSKIDGIVRTLNGKRSSLDKQSTEACSSLVKVNMQIYTGGTITD